MSTIFCVFSLQLQKGALFEVGHLTKRRGLNSLRFIYELVFHQMNCVACRAFRSLTGVPSQWAILHGKPDDSVYNFEKKDFSRYFVI